MIKMSSIWISRFRGVPHTLDLNLKNKSNQHCSLILFGDNGSGKSSIVDAFEFALQGNIGRDSGKLTSPRNPSVFSLKHGQASSVKVVLSSGAEIKRDIIIDDEEGVLVNRNPHSAFHMSPLVLRRSDILKFWETPEEKKQVLFFQYFKSLSKTTSPALDASVEENIRDINEQIVVLKTKRRQLLEKLGAKISSRAFEDLSGDMDLEKWVTEHPYNGVPSKKREAMKSKGKSVMVPHDQYQALLKIRQLGSEINLLNKKRKSIISEENATKPSPKLSGTTQGLYAISNIITELFLDLSTASAFVEHIKINLSSTSAASFTIDVNLKNGRCVAPQQVFSEANMDLLALLVYFAIAINAADNGQAKVLVLDDVFQSVDGIARLKTLDRLCEKMKDWQFIITTHDRLWAEQVKSLFRRLNIPFFDKEIIRWSFDDGPIIADAGHSVISGLSSCLNDGQVYQICSESGLLLEKVCQRLSCNLPISVT